MTRKLTLAMPVVALSVSSFAAAQTPVFNDRLELNGSTIYNGIEDLNDDAGDWFIDKTGDGGVQMDGPGLVFTPGTGSGTTSIQAQLKREYHVGDGVGRAAFRLIVEDREKIGFFAGLYLQTDDTTTPIQAAYFRKPVGGGGEDDTKVDLVTQEGAGSTVKQDKFQVTNGAPFDIVLEIDGTAAAGNKVTFWWRTSPTGDWSDPETVTTHVPIDAAKLLFAVRAFTAEEGGTSERLTAVLFEYDAPAPTEN